MQDSNQSLAESLLRLGPDAFALLVRGPRRRLLPLCLAVPPAGRSA